MEEKILTLEQEQELLQIEYVPTDEYYTPIEIIKSLRGNNKDFFDLDPCGSIHQPFEIAKKKYTILDNGLKQEWSGNIYMNPPFSGGKVKEFTAKFLENRKGIVLIHDQLYSCQKKLRKECDAFFIFDKRISFMDYSGGKKNTPRNGTILFAFGKENIRALKRVQKVFAGEIFIKESREA
jgi:hypothetical protein